ncbi:hypothetical protein [Streptomyces sp. cg35]|uniref:hypothetical protein n=1 Tax=Streptomyces sp. cg35 TaxID=3421650 RepID=UPI003D168751
MDRQQILSLYEWSPGVCFRHPAKGEQSTTVVKQLRIDGEDVHDVRACVDCLFAMEEMRREAAAREGREYEPGLVGAWDA